jgi:predicted dehydrogenase
MSTSNKLRMALAGCGRRGLVHLAAAAESGAIDTVAVCDIVPEKAQEAARQFGVAAVYRDIGDMIAAHQPDLVDIVTMPTVRVGIVEEAVAAGARHILLEKPIALKPSEARRLAELGRQAFIAVNTQYQWMPHWQRFWPLFEQRFLGEIRTLHVSTRANIFEQGPHLIELALKIADLSQLPRPQWILAAGHGLERYGPNPVPADLCATVSLGPEARMYLNHGPSAPPSPGETVFWYHMILEATGTRGRLWVSLNRGWQLWREGGFESGTTGWPHDDHAAQRAMFAALRDAIVAGTTGRFPTRIELSKLTSDLIFASLASAGGAGRLPLPAELDDSVVGRLESLPGAGGT